ncbi:uncharacterized protein MYCGRDRAFT_42031 [Zymoseptoria tritici IPO323]|uniref:N-acetyltransferase domain-containing protein n=1 Tax=Zymoseptoria tritici (strain CBS 115943 / IPO323) TaxID=336722 RepID=F9XCJ4_ZYMTI|nr:uncharacterized protein MYCGRDRAFT_42031 [Zymoseptoria tritici IPO323]EGP87583.1 hypothetical protein MYCGRDRAFT_42031 [Zymoseptoria tritici IPO323]
MSASQQGIIIWSVQTEEDVHATASLFEAYAQSLVIDLTFHDVSGALASLFGKYAPPVEALLLAHKTPSGGPVGCVGLRPLSMAGTCEMKHLYVDQEGRGLGLGRALASRIIVEAKRLGYRAILLNTLRSIETTIGLCKSLGFVEVDAHYYTPLENTVNLRLELQA